MRKLYTILRVVGYVAGLVGLLLFTTGRQGGPDHASRAAAGGILLLVAFAAFFGTYVIYVLNALSRRGGGGRTPRETPPNSV